MCAKSIHAEPSFFYLVMAKSCFRRAVSTPHPKAGGALRETARQHQLGVAVIAVGCLLPPALRLDPISGQPVFVARRVEKLN